MKIWEFWNWEGESRYFSTKEKAELAAIRWMLVNGEGSEYQIEQLLADGAVSLEDNDLICSISEIFVE